VERVAWTALTAVGGGRGCRGGPCGALRCYRTRRHAVNSSRGTRGTFQTSRLCSQRGRRHVLWVVRLPSPAVFRDFRSPPPERARVPAFTTFAPSQDATREHRPGQSHPGAVQRRPVPEVPESDGGPARSTTAPPGDARAACRGTSVQSLQRPTGARADACSCADGGIIARPAAAVSNEHQLNSAAAGARSHAGHVVHHGRRCCRFGAPSPLASPAKTGRRSPQAWHFLLQAAPRRHLASC
jgi:hypothetical protein